MSHSFPPSNGHPDFPGNLPSLGFSPGLREIWKKEPKFKKRKKREVGRESGERVGEKVKEGQGKSKGKTVRISFSGFRLKFDFGYIETTRDLKICIKS